MARYDGRIQPERYSVAYRPHPIRGQGSLTPTKDGLAVNGLRNGEEERPALILGTVFFLVCAGLLQLGIEVGFNWVALGGFLLLMGIFALITQKTQPKEQLIPWKDTACFHAVSEDTVELLIRDGVMKRYLKFRFDEPKTEDFLSECRPHTKET